ncbi:uncharacterized protein LOC134534813 [Bacillus rossius redtenbacheri]|uniref:uncharacterized protein LOC134534813 n=1 Tax=Bacillus rossius redtenbacheri TaxID=93214 RepID=UPI002FDD344B
MFKGRGSKKAAPRSRLLRERANMSFFIVVVFFAVFGIIVLTEIFLIDERGRGAGVVVAHRSGAGAYRRRGQGDRPDYEDSQGFLQAEDYLVYRGAGFDDSLGLFVREERPGAAGARPPLDAAAAAAGAGPGAGGLPAAVESRLPGVATNLTARDGAWQVVSGTRYKFFVFSAFYDRREEKCVRVIGATKTRGPERVWCRLWYPAANGSSAHSVSVAAKVKVIRENWNLKYSACFVLCPLRGNLTAPASVSVVSRLRAAPANRLSVRGAESRAGNSSAPEASVAVCVKPLHFTYNQPLQMLEFLELYGLLGVRHFTLYNHTIGPQVACVLEDYVSRGTVTLLPWQLNMASQKEIRTEGLFAALNDCLYRSMHRYSYVALVDLDEFIVPRHNDTLQDLIRWLGSRLNTKNTGSYSFQNAFFYLQWGDDGTALASGDPLERSLVTLRKTRRRAKLHPHKQRSKYLCRPERVVEAGNHFVWEFVPGHGTLNVPPDAAILHHYRVCEFGGDDCVKTASALDRTAHRYRAPLLQRVAARWRLLGRRCGLPETPPAPGASATAPAATPGS